MPTINPPMYAYQLIDRIARDHVADKPHAFDTPFRHSSGGDCALKLALHYSGVPESDPFDEPSMWSTWLGTLVHEKWQEACAENFSCEAEVRVHDSQMLASGSLDLLHERQGASEVPPHPLSVTVEFKLVNGTKFLYAAGIYKRGPMSKWMKAKGPASGHVIQLALNTMAAGSEYGVLSYLSTEAASKGVQKAINRNCERQMEDTDRFIIEWTYTREELEPIAAAELARLEIIKAEVDASGTPSHVEPYAVGDDFKETLLDPKSDPMPWNCDYCNYLSVCPIANGEQYL